MVSHSRWTIVPSAWSGHRLYDWGRGGLRSTGNVWVRGGGRPRKRFDYHVGAVGFAELRVGGDRRLLLRVKSLAPGEVWPVYERAGKYWARRYYIVPGAAVRVAGEQLEAERGGGGRVAAAAG